MSLRLPLTCGLCLLISLGFARSARAQESPASDPTPASETISEAESSAATDPTGDRVRLVVYLDVPVFIDVQLRRGADSYRKYWRTLARQRFETLDKDDSGVLEATEAEPFVRTMSNPDARVPVRQSFIRSLFGSSRRKTSLDAIDTAPRDGEVSFEEYTTFLTSKNKGRFSVHRTQQQNARGVSERARALLDALDTDDSEGLSPAEIAAASEVARRYDDDGDETLSFSELIANPYQNQGVSVNSGDATNSRLRDTSRVANRVAIFEEEPAGALLSELMSRYGRLVDASRQRVPLSEFPLTGAETYDADKDGLLDETELLALVLERRADYLLEVTLSTASRTWQSGSSAEAVPEPVAVGSKSPGTGTRIIRQPDEGGSYVTLTPEGFALFSFEDVHLEVGASGSESTYDVTASYKQQFAAADTDNNAYLDEEECDNSFIFQNQLAAMDADGNEMVFEDEMVAYISGKAAEADSMSRVTVVDADRNLFDALDRDRDMRLSLKEFADSKAQTARWDRDADGELTPNEIPQQVRLVFAKETPQFRGFSFDSGVGRSVTRRGSNSGPNWFKKMDRNRDGDVSPREFLGPADQFDTLDADGDGLLSAEEASSVKAE